MSVEKPPMEGLIDKVIKLVKAGVDSSLPGGAVATELLFDFIKMPYQRRSEKWQQEVTDTLNKLQEIGVDLEKLKTNEEFIDILLQIIPMGLKHHQSEKRKALRSAILNSALLNAPELYLQQTFLTYIDIFTIWHMKILTFCSNPEQWFEDNKKELPALELSSIKTILQVAFPELNRKDDFINYIWNDLYNKGLLSSNINLLYSMMSGRGLFEKRTTSLGEQFIDFISN